MILIADSGSTKCAWKIVFPSGETRDITTAGLNPFFCTTDSILTELGHRLVPYTTLPVRRIYFYGSGIINEEKASVVRLALQQLFPGAITELSSDVLAAARALFGTAPGIACILGTGSNASLYNGKELAGGISPLGFILGDEGSGAVLGRKLLGDYFKEVMPPELRIRFEAKFGLTRDEALQRVYREAQPNRFLASFVPFLSEESDSPYAIGLVKESLDEFFARNVIKIPGYSAFPIGFVGSVAYFFREIVKEVCTKYKLTCISIQQGPMEGLVTYHLNETL